MAVPVRTYLNVGIRLLQMAFAGVVLAAAVSLQHIRNDNEKFMNHPPTLHFVAAVSSLTVAGGLFGLSLTWYTCLVKYGRVVDLLGIMLNLAAGSLLAVKVKWTRKDKREEMYNGPEDPKCGEESKLSWLIGDKCENMGLRCRLSRVASILCFLMIALLLATLAFGSFVKRKSGLPAAQRKKQPNGDVEMDTGTCTTATQTS